MKDTVKHAYIILCSWQTHQ